MPDSEEPTPTPEAVPQPAPQEARGARTHPASALVRVWLFVVAAGVGSAQQLVQELDLLRAVVVAGLGLVAGAVYGLVRWLTTRYVIDGREVRVDSGLLTRTSRRAPYERIQSVDVTQPLGARILGLAELRVELAGGGDSHVSLQYLSRRDAHRLRGILLERAHAASAPVPHDGEPFPAAPGPMNGPMGGPVGRPAAPTAAATPERVVARVDPVQLVVGTLLSIDLIVGVIGTVVVLAVAAVLQEFWLVFSVLVPFAGNVARIVAGRVVAQWGFTLTRGPRGLAVERGLLSRVSQTVPVDRVQGIAVEQPVLWRRWGWRRLQVDVAGRVGDSGDDQPSTILPIGSAALARAVVAEVLPDIDPDLVPVERVPERSWWLAPIGWRYRAAGADERAFVSTTGWITHRADVVPHAKTQSVAIEQGPLQRRLGLADLSVHTPDGPVAARARNTDATRARRLAESQLVAARTSRRAAQHAAEID